MQDNDFEYSVQMVESSERFRSPGPGWELVKVDDSTAEGKVQVTWRRLVNGTDKQARVLYG